MQTRRHSRWRPGSRGVIAVAAVLLFGAGYYWGSHYRQRTAAPAPINGVTLTPAVKLPAFRLADAAGRTVSEQSLAHGWSLLAVGDLAEDAGKRALRRLIDVYNRLADEPALRAQVQLVLLDTGTTPDLARQTAALTPALSVLRAAAPEGAALRTALGADSSDSATIYVIGPSGDLVAVFPRDEAGGAMAEDLKHLAAAHQS